MENLRLKIRRDPDPESPRDWDNVGIMVHSHPSYMLGDKRVEPGHAPDGAIVILPLYLYEHSGVTMSTGPFTDLFDSGQVGWIYATKESVRKIWGDHKAPTTAELEEILRSEVETFDHYLTGNVWGFEIERVSQCECCGTEKVTHEDSCWGFLGDDDAKADIREHLSDDAAELLDQAWEDRFE